jgi:hypothetical protein
MDEKSRSRDKKEYKPDMSDDEDVLRGNTHPGDDSFNRRQRRSKQHL